MIPWTYRYASRDFGSFLSDAKQRMDLVSDNSTYTAVDAVFQVFRRRLTVEQGLAFAGALPSVLCAIFIREWDVTRKPVSFSSREVMSREAQQVRKHHNLTPDNAIEATAWALRRHVDQRDLDRVLEALPLAAREYWHVDVSDPAELQQRIF